MEMLLPQKLHDSSSSITSEDSTEILSIVGAGGMGKTALAQLLFNDQAVKSHFHCNIWICVSDPFEQIKLAKSILEGLKNPNESVQMETLLQAVQESVLAKRFLLVLDDVWSEDDSTWEPLKVCLLKNGAPGSRILVTTRNRRVAEVMGSSQSQIHLLAPLADSYCWSILSRMAFHERSEVDREMLTDIGMKIAFKCKGFPLAAKTLGSLLRFKSGLQEWEAVLNSEMFELERVRNDLFPILALSYNELPPEVKICFSYCAVYPKDFIFEVEELVRIWIAQGFIGSSSNEFAGESAEQKGMRYFENLAMHSLFQDFVSDEELGEKCILQCKMHDIIHDFAQFLTENECSIIEGGCQRLTGKNTRHLFLKDFADKKLIIEEMSSCCRMENLHSFFCIDKEIDLELLLNHLKRVRTLSLIKNKILKIPKEIGNLTHLRYLNLSGNDLMELPPTIYDLYNLETLDLQDCIKLCTLPEGINKLGNLRHLLNGGTQWNEFPQGFQALTNLQTLEQFICQDGSQSNLGHLMELNQLRGCLYILVHVDGLLLLEAEKADLKNKKPLQHMILYFDGDVKTEIVEALQPPPNLWTLCFKGECYIPNWMSSITNLRRLEICLTNMVEVDLSCLKNLHFLETLNMSEMGMKSLKSFRLINRGSSSTTTTTREIESRAEVTFSRLKTIEFIGCNEWEEWEDLTEEEDNMIVSSLFLPCLQLVHISECGMLKALPHRFISRLSSLTELQIIASPLLEERYKKENGEDWHYIFRIPNVSVYRTVHAEFLEDIKNIGHF